ncbi:hypothetical protein ACT2VT_003243 [Pantoea agglomerans]
MGYLDFTPTKMQVNPSVMQAGYLSLLSDNEISNERSPLSSWSKRNSHVAEIAGNHRKIGHNTRRLNFFKSIFLTGALEKNESTYKKHTYEINYFFKCEGVVYDANSKMDSTITYNLPEMLDKIKEVFGLPVSNIASIVGVSRATIYNHISSSSAEVSEYNDLFEIALTIDKNGWDVKKGLKSVVVDGKTLLKHLNSKPLDTDKILEVSRMVSTKIKEMSSQKQLTSEEEKIVSILNNY